MSLSQLTLLMLLASPHVVEVEASERTLPNCGVQSIVDLSHALGQPLGATLATNLASAYPNEQVNLADVCDMANQVDLPLDGVAVDAAELLEAQVPAIVHLRDPEHFVALLGGDADWVQLWAGELGGLVVQPRPDFEQRYTGHAAVLGGLMALQVGISSDRQHWAADEVVAVGDLIHASFVVTNRGLQPVTLTPLASSCTCTTTLKGEQVVEPGQTLNLPVEVKVRGVGDTLEYVRLRTSDPHHPTLYLSVSARANRGVELRPTTLRIAVDQGQCRQRQVYVLGPPGLSVTSAVVDPPWADVAVVRRVADVHGTNWVLSVTTREDAPVGDHTLRLIVHTNHEPESEFHLLIQLRVRE